MQLARMAEITKVFVQEGLGFLIASREAGKSASKTAEVGEPVPDAIGEGEGEGTQTALVPRDLPDSELAARLRRTLERLGPTFVKFGQMLSTRVDLFEESFVTELAKLQSEVAPFPTAQAREIIEAELGRPIGDVFDEFPDEPVAAASIAQVYKARLRDRPEGEQGWVAIKVQRPGLEESLLRDLEALISISGMIDTLVPTYRRSMVHKVAQEYARRARGELDFMSEARAIDQFSDVLRSLPEFRAPGVHHSLCTPRLLVMEWLEGNKLDTVGGPERLSELGFVPEAFARSMLKLQVSMSYEHGFVHGDTHPGNVILLPSGHIGLIDFGLHGHVPRALRDKMLEMIFYQSAGRIDEAVDAFVAVFKPDPNSDVEAFKHQMRAMLEAEAGPHSLAQNRITEQLIRGMRMGAQYHLEAQSDLFVVIRNLTIVEGIVLRYCPTIDPNEEVRTIVGDIMRRKVFGPGMRDEMTQLVPQVLLNLSQRPRLAERLLKLERTFVASKTLGDFLRQERVLAPLATPRRSTASLVLAALVGAVIGALIHALI